MRARNSIAVSQLLHVFELLFEVLLRGLLLCTEYNLLQEMARDLCAVYAFLWFFFALTGFEHDS